MLFSGNNPMYICKGSFVLLALLLLCALYAYRVNRQRPADDLQKRVYRPGAILLAPFTWPIILLAATTGFILTILFYLISLLISLFLFIVHRKPFLLIWLEKVALKIGNKLLKANTLLLDVIFHKS